MFNSIFWLCECAECLNERRRKKRNTPPKRFEFIICWNSFSFIYLFQSVYYCHISLSRGTCKGKINRCHFRSTKTWRSNTPRQSPFIASPLIGFKELKYGKRQQKPARKKLRKKTETEIKFLSLPPCVHHCRRDFAIRFCCSPLAHTYTSKSIHKQTLTASQPL